MIRDTRNFPGLYKSYTARGGHVLQLDTNRKSHVGCPTAPAPLTLCGFETSK